MACTDGLCPDGLARRVQPLAQGGPVALISGSLRLCLALEVPPRLLHRGLFLLPFDIEHLELGFQSGDAFVLGARRADLVPARRRRFGQLARIDASPRRMTSPGAAKAAS